MLEIYPNPATDRIQARIVSGDGALTTASVLDLSGRILLQSEIGFEAGVLEVNLQEIPAGIYLLQVQMEDGSSMVRKFIRR